MKLKFNTFILLSLFVFGAVQGISQKEFVWDYYGIGFAVERDFKVELQNNQIFQARSSDGLIAMSIEPWFDETINIDDLYNYVLKQAIELDFYDGGDVVGGYLEIDDFDGYFLISAPNDETAYDYVLIALLLDTESDTNSRVIIGFEEGNEEEVLEMINSFYAYD